MLNNQHIFCLAGLFWQSLNEVA